MRNGITYDIEINGITEDKDLSLIIKDSIIMDIGNNKNDAKAINL